MRSQCLFVLWRCSPGHLFCRKKKPFLHGCEQLFVRNRFTELHEHRLIGLLLYRPCCSSFLPQIRCGHPACVHLTSFHRCPSSSSRSTLSLLCPKTIASVRRTAILKESVYAQRLL